MRTTTRRLLRGIVVTAAVAALMVPSAALAKGRPDNPGSNGHHGGGNSGQGKGNQGGPGEEVGGNNLSVPVIFMGSLGGFTVVCGSDNSMGGVVAPKGDPATGFELDPAAYYYVQGTNEWQSDCQVSTETTINATVAWGDNLGGDARLNVGNPIRVEIVLTNEAGQSGNGFFVEKLEPGLLDRNSAYGTLASGDSVSGFSASSQELAALVYDPDASLKIWNVDTNVYLVGSEAEGDDAGAEINATGKIVYGYNLRVPDAGTYEIEYTFPNVSLTGYDIGSVDGHVATLEITVPSGAGE